LTGIIFPELFGKLLAAGDVLNELRARREALDETIAKLETAPGPPAAA
jgi:hypothetical protein